MNVSFLQHHHTPHLHVRLIRPEQLSPMLISPNHMILKSLGHEPIPPRCCFLRLMTRLQFRDQSVSAAQDRLLRSVFILKLFSLFVPSFTLINQSPAAISQKLINTQKPSEPGRHFTARQLWARHLLRFYHLRQPRFINSDHLFHNRP